MTSQFKDMVPELIAYQLVIVQHSKRFEYPSWLHYDIQWGAATKFTQWSQIHPQFYAFTFTGALPGARWMGGTSPLIAPSIMRVLLD